MPFYTLIKRRILTDVNLSEDLKKIHIYIVNQIQSHSPWWNLFIQKEYLNTLTPVITLITANLTTILLAIVMKPENFSSEIIIISGGVLTSCLIYIYFDFLEFLQRFILESLKQALVLKNQENHE